MRRNCRTQHAIPLKNFFLFVSFSINFEFKLLPTDYKAWIDRSLGCESFSSSERNVLFVETRGCWYRSFPSALSRPKETVPKLLRPPFCLDPCSRIAVRRNKKIQRNSVGRWGEFICIHQHTRKREREPVRFVMTHFAVPHRDTKAGRKQSGTGYGLCHCK